MQTKFNELRAQLDHIKKDLLGFNVEFYDEARFKSYINDHFDSLLGSYQSVNITGYVSEGFAKIVLKNPMKANKIRLITQRLNLKMANDRKNLESLRRLYDAGAEIRVNQRVHCRMLLCRNREHKGLLILGSFDFNKEGMNEERRDAGIYTTHPDLIESAFTYFNKMWEDKYDTKPFNELYP